MVLEEPYLLSSIIFTGPQRPFAFTKSTDEEVYAMYDIVIVGAGPAGATLARLAAGNYRILLLDKRELTGSSAKKTFEKCCGGLLAPDAQHMLAVLGLGIPREILVGPQLFTVRTIDLCNKLERYYQRHYINVDREAFDRWLVSLVPNEVDICCGALYKSHSITEDGVKVNYIYKGKECTANTRILAGADGAGSKVRADAFPGMKSPDLYVSIQEWYKAQNSLPYFSSIFDEEITDFYSWTIPKDDCLLVGTAIPYGENAWARFELLKTKLKSYGFDLKTKIKTKGALICRPKKLGHIHNGAGSIALLGEAAGWISPSSAEGMSYSFKSALALAGSLEAGIEGYMDRYAKKTASLRRNIFIKNLKAPFMYHTKIRKMVMQSGLLSMDILVKA